MKKVVTFLFVLVLVLAVFWLVYQIGHSFLSAFDGATPSVKAASIASFVTVFTFLAGRYFEQSRENKSRANIEKIGVYQSFFDLYFDLFMAASIRTEEREPNSIARELVQFQKQLILWGSDTVLREFLNFKQALSQFGVDQENRQDVVISLKPVMVSAANLLRAMRQDVGYRFTSFSVKDLAIMQLQGDDSENQRLMDSL